MVVIILVSRLLENVLSKDDCDLIVVCFLVFDVVVVVRFVVQKLYGIEVEIDDEDEDYYVMIFKCFMKFVKGIVQVMVSIFDIFFG